MMEFNLKLKLKRQPIGSNAGHRGNRPIRKQLEPNHHPGSHPSFKTAQKTTTQLADAIFKAQNNNDCSTKKSSAHVELMSFAFH
jgi:hypothetical protein